MLDADGVTGRGREHLKEVRVRASVWQQLIEVELDGIDLAVHQAAVRLIPVPVTLQAEGDIVSDALREAELQIAGAAFLGRAFPSHIFPNTHGVELGVAGSPAVHVQGQTGEIDPRTVGHAEVDVLIAGDAVEGRGLWPRALDKELSVRGGLAPQGSAARGVRPAGNEHTPHVHDLIGRIVPIVGVRVTVETGDAIGLTVPIQRGGRAEDRAVCLAESAGVVLRAWHHRGVDQAATDREAVPTGDIFDRHNRVVLVRFVIGQLEGEIRRVGDPEGRGDVQAALLVFLVVDVPMGVQVDGVDADTNPLGERAVVVDGDTTVVPSTDFSRNAGLGPIQTGLLGLRALNARQTCRTGRSLVLSRGLGAAEENAVGALTEVEGFNRVGILGSGCAILEEIALRTRGGTRTVRGVRGRQLGESALLEPAELTVRIAETAARVEGLARRPRGCLVDVGDTQRVDERAVDDRVLGRNILEFQNHAATRADGAGVEAVVNRLSNVEGIELYRLGRARGGGGRSRGRLGVEGDGEREQGQS